MTDSGEITYQRWNIARRGPTDGWENVATEIIHFDAEHSEPKPSEEQVGNAVAQVGSFVTRVLAHIDEPTVFQHRHNGFLQFSTVIPNREEPFHFYPDKPAIYLASTEKKFDYSIATMPGGRDIVIRSNTPDYLDLWMGAGARSEYTNIPFFSEPASENIAVGGEEIADLFATLRSKDDAINGRLFGGLMHIAWLADDFEATIPVVPSFEPEAEKAITLLDYQDEAIRSGKISISESITKLGEMARNFKIDADIYDRTLDQMPEVVATVRLPRLANGAPNDGYGMRSLLGAIVSFQDLKRMLERTLDKEAEEQRGRNRQRKLANALIGNI